MANRAVIGAVAVGAGVYAISETLRERRCQLEAEEEKREREDLLKARTRRIEEDLRRGEGKDTRMFFEVEALMLHRKHLWAILEHIRKNADRRKDARLYGIHLPLLEDKSKTNSLDEIVFAAALALGDENLLQDLFQQEKIQVSTTLPLQNRVSCSLRLTSICL